MGLFRKDEKNKMPPMPRIPAKSLPPMPVPSNHPPIAMPPPGIPRGYQSRPVPAPIAEPPTMAPPSPVSGSPPLFIKIEKYREVVKNLMEAKSFVLNLRDALDALSDVQKEISNGVQVAHKTLDELNENLSSLDSFFIKPGKVQGAVPPGPSAEKPEDAGPQKPPVDNYVKDVYGQLERLRSQLKSLQ